MNACYLTIALNGHWHGCYGTACCLAHDDSNVIVMPGIEL